jgi:hypothetical protein
MRNVKWLVAAALAVSATGCVETNGYPTTSYGGGYPSSYGYSNGYYAQPTYYQQQPAYYQPAPVVTQARYVPVPVAQPAPQRRLRDSDHDGIPDRYDRDKNGDGIPDRYQRQTSR